MQHKYIEKMRLLWVVIFAIIAGFLTNYYLLSLIVFLFLYIVWLLNNLFKVNLWLENGVKIEQSPPYNGAWGSLISYVIKLKKQYKHSSKKHQKLIIRFNEILRSLPYPTVVINANNEIQWISKDAAILLNLHRKKDIGIRINNIIRSEEFSNKLSQTEVSELLIKVNNTQSLKFAISKLNRDIRILSIQNNNL